MASFKKGKLYKISFLDHCVGLDHSMKCQVVGWIVKQSSKSVTLSHWIIDHSCEEVKSENLEYTTILKSTILKSREIK